MKRQPGSDLPETRQAALERSVIYRGFADAFRRPDGGCDVLDETLIPPPPPNARKAFVDAFDEAISKSACSLHEAAHSTRDQMDLFEELVRWYDHFGLRRTDTAELPDHISVQLEFMHFLTHQEYLHGDEPEAAETLRSAQREFLSRHLMPLAQSIEEKCRDDLGRYSALADQLPAYLALELERRGTD